MAYTNSGFDHYDHPNTIPSLGIPNHRPLLGMLYLWVYLIMGLFMGLYIYICMVHIVYLFIIYGYIYIYTLYIYIVCIYIYIISHYIKPFKTGAFPLVSWFANNLTSSLYSPSTHTTSLEDLKKKHFAWWKPVTICTKYWIISVLCQ